MQLCAELLCRLGLLGVFGEVREFVWVFLVVIEFKALLPFVPFGVAIAVGPQAVADKSGAGLRLLLCCGVGVGGFRLGFSATPAAAADLRKSKSFTGLAGIVHLRDKGLASQIGGRFEAT